MTPTGNDDGGDIPDEPKDELIAQIVPLRRRDDDSERGESPHGEPRAAADDTDDWSVFDPPEDLQPAERSRRDTPGDRHGDVRDDSLASHADAARPHGRLVAFAGIALTTVAIAALAVLTLKGHAGASPRPPAPLRPNTALPGAGSVQTVSQRPSPSSRRRSTPTPPSHRVAKRRASPRSRTLPRAGEEASTIRSSGEPAATRAPSEPSSPSPTSTARGGASEFGIEP